MKKIFISSDHAGFKLKEDIKELLISIKLNFKDLGPVNDKSVDYPDYAHKLAKKVKVSKNNVGILVCGSGTGMNIAANKHKNIRAAQCFNTKYHNAFNGGEENRIHLVACILDYKFN